jgi:MazG family protein
VSQPREPLPQEPLPDAGFARLVAVMARLRAEDGCPWDREQTLQTLRKYLIEESHELLDAIDGLGTDATALPAQLPLPQADPEATALLKEELGDVLLQVVFQSRIAQESGWFTVDDVAKGIADKMERRHPHVFGDGSAKTAQEVTRTWEQIKRQEGKGALAGVPRQLPALLRGQRIGEKAARIGFDWPDAAPVLDKVEEELLELREAMASGNRAAMSEELGDLLFALTSLGRKLDLDADAALHGTLDKFTRRFSHVEQQAEARYGRENQATLDQLEALWQEAKRIERA